MIFRLAYYIFVKKQDYGISNKKPCTYVDSIFCVSSSACIGNCYTLALANADFTFSYYLPCKGNEHHLKLLYILFFQILLKKQDFF